MYQNLYQPQYVYGNIQQNLRQPPRRVNLDESMLASSHDLGNGFHSFSWNQRIGVNETVTYFLSARGLKVISAGWAPRGYESLYALESYPRDINRWTISVVNSAIERDIFLYLIAKN
ncbi:hypothetical protein [Paenibacillus sp. F4]|uniref:hypothetical protein n=1 Tax=Paenibacillus sp. F4 TaxID=357385 RepID=UPI000C9F5F15|nr:hypothetical protein [Paenibacillus sp. F4]PNQ79678.1 hypothetical protein C1T21_16850 [Paenibacillus sp. F4]